MNDGIYFEVFAVKNGIRYNMKILNSRDVSLILTNNLMNGIEEIIIDTKTDKKQMVGDTDEN